MGTLNPLWYKNKTVVYLPIGSFNKVMLARLCCWEVSLLAYTWPAPLTSCHVWLLEESTLLFKTQSYWLQSQIRLEAGVLSSVVLSVFCSVAPVAWRSAVCSSCIYLLSPLFELLSVDFGSLLVPHWLTVAWSAGKEQMAGVCGDRKLPWSSSPSVWSFLMLVFSAHVLASMEVVYVSVCVCVCFEGQHPVPLRSGPLYCWELPPLSQKAVVSWAWAVINISKPLSMLGLPLLGPVAVPNGSMALILPPISMLLHTELWELLESSFMFLSSTETWDRVELPTPHFQARIMTSPADLAQLPSEI